MDIKNITNYILKKYNDEILESTYDSANSRKNRIKDYEKLKWLKSEIANNFKVEGLITDFKPGPSYNRTDTPWIQIHDSKNSKGTLGEYVGISFNKETSSIQIWIGFGIGGVNKKLKKKEIIEKHNIYTNKFLTIEPNPKRGFSYNDKIYEATIINKGIPVDEINNEEVKKDLDYLGNIYKLFENIDSNPSRLEAERNEKVILPSDKKIEGQNIIYVGAPGCGKSYKVKEEYLALKDENGNIVLKDRKMQLIDSNKYETVVFYREYSNANFVGSILPVIKENRPSYEFVPGPFTKILKRAIDNPKTNFYLIIEELNRGNAAAIFGDIFLLLDRENGASGASVYTISNDLIANYVYGDSNKKIFIPNNLSIIATMNSSDQNTIPIDTAFKRRWDIIWVSDQENEDIDNLYIKGFGDITWGKFRTTINKRLTKAQNSIYKLEDKKLCSYFIDKSYLSKTSKNSDKDLDRFIYKVLINLFEDACKYEKTLIFNQEIMSIDELVQMAKEDIFKIFNEEIEAELTNE